MTLPYETIFSRTRVNKLLGENRVIVSDIAGTTRDAIDTEIVRNGTEYVFIDTAGLRRKSKIKEDIERYSIIRTVSAVERCNINIQFLVFLICIDLASLENIKNENLFQLFTFDNIFDWDFFHVFKEYDRLSKNYKDAVTRFLHAANICNQNESRKNNN